MEAITDALTDRISQRAYELFVARGCEHGRDMDDWLEAEREVRNGNQTMTTPSSVTGLRVDADARGALRRKQYEDGARLVGEID